MVSQLPIGPDSPWLAPLAGFSDLPFRLLCREQGAAVACTEMVSAKGLVYGMRQKGHASGGKSNGATEDLLVTTPEDAPLVVQLFGAEPEFLAEAVRTLSARGFFWFDLNMGCSVPKVTKTGAGSALLRDPSRALSAAAAFFRAAGPGRAGCKIRLGWDATASVFLDLGQALEDAGAAWITLHPRFARQGFCGAVDASAWEKLARAVSIPVLASGELFRAEDGLRCLSTGVRGVMFARGAMTNPGIFRQYHALRSLPEEARHGAGKMSGALLATAGNGAADAQGREELLALLLRHAELARRLSADTPARSGLPPALLKMRGIAPRYARHLPGVKRLRLALANCRSWDELQCVLRGFFAEDDRGSVD